MCLSNFKYMLRIAPDRLFMFHAGLDAVKNACFNYAPSHEDVWGQEI
jgi:hypothetical protein